MRPAHAAAIAVACLTAQAWPVAQNRLPGRLDHYLTTTVNLSPAERNSLLAGKGVVRMLSGDASKEMAVFGAIWIAAPVAAYLRALDDIESFESGQGFRVTKKISDPPTISDFARLELPEEDVDDLRSCRVGSCEMKLSEEALMRFRKEVDWSRADARQQVDRLLRQLALEYVDAYRVGGNSRLAVYRDRSHPTFVADEFRTLVKAMPELADYAPGMRRYLLDYPNAAEHPASSFLYWQDAEFGLKPTIRINHVAVQEGPEATVVASKQLYSTHYFWTALEFRALVRDPARGEGFWFVNVNRSRGDGLGGFVGTLIRGRVQDGVRRGMEAALAATKRRLETR